MYRYLELGVVLGVDGNGNSWLVTFVGDLMQDVAHQVLELELKTNADYPYTPATAHELPTEESTLELWKSGTWIFGTILSLYALGIRNFSTGGQHLMLQVSPLSRAWDLVLMRFG